MALEVHHKDKHHMVKGKRKKALQLTVYNYQPVEFALREILPRGPLGPQQPE